MTTEEAAKAVVECWDNRTFQWSVPAVFLARIVNLRTALSASPWVSVKERMPKSFDEDGDRFLVFTDRGEFQIHGAYLGYWPQSATHWMKLEKP